MEDRICIGNAILDYLEDIKKIVEQLQDAYILTVECRTLVESDQVYKGKAKDEMYLFFASLEANIQKMIFLYNAASSYASNVYQSFYYDEQQLVEHVISMIGES